ncbi:hypothetical protein BJ138DRAFT_1090460 [Hygrophoropsis aurantiaca]|uniref:Uncharacterized protein n=1 Tax=Hygrophoropsis aurantiaca TaxID=72124 RepID=A0ACB8A765_9AGAM|nr:hypothetical protein BJ138DRAFT_1090460 [Hygrophoropsis aurantiaca]
MSGPYVYSPSPYEPTRYHAQYNQPQRSPFIPPASLYPSSPYTPTSSFPDLPTTPHRVHFDEWPNRPPRSRRPSWHGGMAPPTPPSPSFLHLPTLGHSRRHSFGNHSYRSPFADLPPSSPWSYAPTTPQFQVHPLLNGEALPAGFYFDLASPTFAPVRWIGPGQSAPVSLDELREPATYPPITSMRITHDAIPHWPIDLTESADAYSAALLPITLGDVLWAIHGALHRQITQHDWAQLGDSHSMSIARAYTRRCRSVPSLAQLESSQGVKRVDYLLDKFMFGGLVRAQDEEGFYHWRLLT